MLRMFLPMRLQKISTTIKRLKSVLKSSRITHALKRKRPLKLRIKLKKRMLNITFPMLKLNTPRNMKKQFQRLTKKRKSLLLQPKKQKKKQEKKFSKKLLLTKKPQNQIPKRLLRASFPMKKFRMLKKAFRKKLFLLKVILFPSLRNKRKTKKLTPKTKENALAKMLRMLFLMNLQKINTMINKLKSAQKKSQITLALGLKKQAKPSMNRIKRISKMYFTVPNQITKQNVQLMKRL